MSNRNGVWSLPAQYQAIADQDWTMAPGAPTGVSATAGSTQAEVSFTAPTFAGIPGTITQFKVTSSSGQTATGSSSPITVTGLTNGNAVTFTAQAQNAIGLGKASDASSSVTPLAEVISGLFSTHVYKGNNSTQTVTNNINLSGKGGLVWIKNRSTSSTNHSLFDTVSGATGGNRLRSNLTNALHNFSGSAVFATSSTGFALNSTASQDLNDGSDEYVSWTFRKEPKFFDVVKYDSSSGNVTNFGSAGATVSHNLGSVPGMIIVKCTDTGSTNWKVYHRGLNGGTNPEQYEIELNQTGVQADTANSWNDTAPTSTQFTLGSSGDVNNSSRSYVAYLFAHNNNDGGFGPDSEDIIKCGYYTGNNSTTGPIVDLGFEPQWLLIRHTANDGNSWHIFDNIRGVVTGGSDAFLAPNSSSDEQTAADKVEFNASGFQLKRADGDVNGNGTNYIYVAIRRPDMSTPTSASDVFAVDTRNSTGDGNEPGYRSTFPVDMVVLRKDMTQNGGETHVINRLTGNKYLKTYDNSSESSDSAYVLDYMNGFNSDTSTKTDRIAWMWKRAKGYFDTVTYSGTGSATTVTHNLGAVPEMMWVKARNATQKWAVYHSALGNTKYLRLNDTSAEITSSTRWNDTTPTASVFTVGTDSQVNNSSYNYIAHLFATVAGVSKVGSYTGNSSSTQDIDCGFTNGAKMVILKQTSHEESWEIYDTTRALVAGNDYRLRLDATDAQATNSDFIDPLNSGFTAVADSNLNGRSYIFYAIAND